MAKKHPLYYCLLWKFPIKGSLFKADSLLWSFLLLWRFPIPFQLQVFIKDLSEITNEIKRHESSIPNAVK